jgi:hypothetical protein
MIEVNVMSSTRRRFERYVIGIFVGAIAGGVLAMGCLILLMVICSADGGGFPQPEPQHQWVRDSLENGFFGAPVVCPLAGVVIGIIWAYRRNRRDSDGTWK